MREKGLHLKTITLTAKDSICFWKSEIAIRTHAPTRLDTMIASNRHCNELVHDVEAVSRQAVEDCAKKYCVCPFELSLDAALWCDAIVGDYNYLFDPVVYLKRFFGESPGNTFFSG